MPSSLCQVGDNRQTLFAAAPFPQHGKKQTKAQKAAEADTKIKAQAQAKTENMVWAVLTANDHANEKKVLEAFGDKSRIAASLKVPPDSIVNIPYKAMQITIEDNAYLHPNDFKFTVFMPIAIHENGKTVRKCIRLTCNFINKEPEPEIKIVAPDK